MCLDCFCAVMQGNHRKVVNDMSTLRERAQEWLDYYKAPSGDVISLPTPETIAAVFAEYLHESAADTQVDSQVEELENKCRSLSSSSMLLENK